MKIFAVIMLLSLRVPLDSCEIEIPELVITSKQSSYLTDMPVSSTSLDAEKLKVGRVESVKELSAVAPNFYQPDYGSAMTSSIYVRGFGSRIDQPVLGLNVDEVPVMNKNGYDFDLFDIYGIDVLRGPQSTLYGRNTSGGVINIKTLSPMSFSGTKFSVDYATANSVKVKMSHYAKLSDRTGVSLGAYYSRSDGFFRNEYNNENCDDGYQSALRMRLVHVGDNVSIDNTLSASYVNQGGFAYRLNDPQNGIMSVNYNDVNSYNRCWISNGTSVKFFLPSSLVLSSITGLQYLNDHMQLDNDFTPDNIFTLNQFQREYSVTQDIVLKSSVEGKGWRHISGIFGFYKTLDMDAPVTMKRDGIDCLILAGANRGIGSMFPGHGLFIQEDMLDMQSSFGIPVWGAALYHQSEWVLERLRFTVGLRVDYESSSMKYNSDVAFNYRFSLTMPSYAPIKSEFDGRKSISSLELLPKASITYDMSKGNVYLSVSRGYKAGGFNTQIFSDILSNRLMKDVMEAVGMHTSGDSVYDSADATTYQPEYAWNYEVGGHFSLGKLSADAALFMIDCRNQQITVFPSKTSLGRVMSNAGHSMSYGAELSASYVVGDLQLSSAYGYTHAEFRRYNNGTTDFSGNRIPYSPQSTLSAEGVYTIESNSVICDEIVLRLHYDRIGKIYWDDANTVCQQPYSLLSASAGIRKGAFELSLWGKNLTDREYETFYFESLGNGFFSSGKPFYAGISLSLSL